MSWTSFIHNTLVDFIANKRFFVTGVHLFEQLLGESNFENYLLYKNCQLVEIDKVKNFQCFSFNTN